MNLNHINVNTNNSFQKLRKHQIKIGEKDLKTEREVSRLGTKHL